MKKVLLALGLVSVLAYSQTPSAVEHSPRGEATYVTNAELQATVQKTASSNVNDTQVRVVGINDEYNVAIGVLHRANTAAHGAGGGLEHQYVTEVYQIVSGTGTFTTGGHLKDAKDAPADGQLVKLLDGPTLQGGPVEGGVSRKVGPGDMIVIPPNTPHWFSEITSDQVVYTVVRIDPRKLLPAGYDASKAK